MEALPRTMRLPQWIVSSRQRTQVQQLQRLRQRLVPAGVAGGAQTMSAALDELSLNCSHIDLARCGSGRSRWSRIGPRPAYRWLIAGGDADTAALERVSRPAQGSEEANVAQWRLLSPETRQPTNRTRKSAHVSAPSLSSTRIHTQCDQAALPRAMDGVEGTSEASAATVDGFVASEAAKAAVATAASAPAGRRHCMLHGP